MYLRLSNISTGGRSYSYRYECLEKRTLAFQIFSHFRGWGGGRKISWAYGLSVCLSDVYIKVLEICDSLRIGLCRPQEDAFGACVLGPVVIIIMIKDNGNLICLSPLFFLAHLPLPFKTDCDCILYLHSQALLS